MSRLPGRIGLCAVLVLATLGPCGGVADERPMRVTTDTLDYCHHLQGRVEEIVRVAPSPPPEVTSLATEGLQLCDQGQLRGGILRLRRALMLLLHQPRNQPLAIDGTGP